MKKKLVVILGVVVLAFLIGAVVWFVRGRQTEEEIVPSKPEGVLIETALEERPYITLTPSSDGHWLTVDVSRIRDADSLEYELLYNTIGGATQGSISSFELKGKSTYSKKILLGSESSGNYKYDEGVTQGTLTIRLRGGEGTRKFVSDFHLQKGDEDLTSIDEKVTLEGSFSSSAFYLTMSTAGLPGDFEGEVIVGPYEVFTSVTSKVKGGELTMSLEEGQAGQLYSWSGSAWEEEESEVEDGVLTAEITSLTTFIVASQKTSTE